MVAPQYLSSALADDDARSHGVAGGHTRQDGTIGDSEIFDSIDLKFGVDHRHGIAPHFCGAGLMPSRGNSVPDEILELRTFQRPRHHLTFRERPKCL
jgi:hypothetical protein